MVARVYRNPVLENVAGFNYGASFLHFLAQAFSLDSGWAIIDSYNPSASPQPRIKGDPMTGGIGGLWGGVAQSSMPNNCWFVIEQVTPEPTFAKIQVKFQCSGNANYACPSGIDYGLEGVNRVSGCRVAPFGGWDLADTNPDFANAITKVSRDMAYTPWPSGSASAFRSWLIMDDDYFVVPQFQPATYINFQNIVFYVGSYTPLRAGQHTVDHPCIMFYGKGTTSTEMFEAYWTNTQSKWFLNCNEASASTDALRVACPDENGVMKQWTAKCPPVVQFMDGSAYPNEFDSPLTMDLLALPIVGKLIDGDPYSPDTRFIGLHKHLWGGYGLGYGAFMQNRDYLPLGSNQFCAVVEWDGSTNFVP